MKFWINLSILLITTCAFSQNETEYDSIYNITARELSFTKPEEALENTKYLYSSTNNIESKIQVLLLEAEILRVYGMPKEALKKLKILDSLVEITNNSRQKLLINGLYATNYRENGLYTAGKRHLEIAQKIINDVEDENEKYKLQGNIFQEMAYINISENNYTEAIKNIKYSNDLFNKMEHEGNKSQFQYAVALNYNLLGSCYSNLKNADSAFYYFDKSKVTIEGFNKNNPLMSSILTGVGQTHLLLENYNEALEYLKEGEKIALESEHYSLKQESFKALRGYYREINDHKNYIDYNEKYLALVDEKNERQKSVTNNLIEVLYTTDEQTLATPENKDSFSYRPFIIGGTFVSLILFYVFLQKRKTTSPTINEHVEYDFDKVITQTKETSHKEDYMSEETIETIYNQLKEMEQAEFFLDKDLSLSVLAAKMGTNQRYLSYVIKHKLDRDFVSYINELRVRYVINYLESDPKHLNYKISYLAEKSGFASHNRFSINFKKVIGISPSEFINNLREVKV